MNVSLCVFPQACPRLSVLTAAPTKQTETASACLHAWNPARPHHARLVRRADACEYNNGDTQRLGSHCTHTCRSNDTHSYVTRASTTHKQCGFQMGCLDVGHLNDRPQLMSRSFPVEMKDSTSGFWT